MKLIRSLIVTAAMGFAGSSMAAVTTIGFAPIPLGDIGSGSYVEGDFTYSLLAGTGGLWGQTVFAGDSTGNPFPHLEGLADAGGGTLRIVRTGAPGGLFNFDSADISTFGFGGIASIVSFTGYLGGLIQASADDLVTIVGDNNWVVRASANLSGVAIDELRVRLDGLVVIRDFRWEQLDNVRLNTVTAPTSNGVPEPSSLALVLLAAAGLGVSRVRKSS